MQHKRILSLLIAFLFFGRLTHLQATQSNLSSKDKKVVLPTLALMFLHNKLSNLSSDTTKDNLQLKRPPCAKRFCLDSGFAPMHVITDNPSRQIPTPKPGDKVRLTTGKVAQIEAVCPIIKNSKCVGFSYTVTLSNKESIKVFYDKRLAGLQSRLARCERQLALGDVVMVKNDAKIIILDGVEDDLKRLDTKEITLNPGSVHKATPIGKVVYLDGDWVGLMQVPLSLSLPPKNKTNSKHSDEKVEDKPLEKQQLGTKRLSRPTRWLVPTSHIQCILNREKRYKVYHLDDKHDKLSDDKRHDLGLRYPLAARSPMGSLIYQTSSSKFIRRMAHFTDSFIHKVLLQGHSTQVLGTEQELLLPAHADGSLPSLSQALASGSLSLYTLSNKPNKDKAWNKYTYVLQPTATAYTAKLSLSVAYHKDEQTHNLLLPKNSPHQPLFWCDKKNLPCRYGLTLKQPSQPLVFSFANECDRRIFYNALVRLTSPYVLAIEEVNYQPTRQTRLLACADTKQMTLKQLAHHMQTQWLVREGTLHQSLHFLDPHFIFEKHQQQSLSKYYDWSHKKRYKKVHISCYRTSHPDCIAHFGRYPQLDNQGKTANICPIINNIMDSLGGLETLLMNGLPPEACQGFCTYVDYLFGKNNNYTFKQAKDHMWKYYHGRPTPCPNQSKCSYHTLNTHQAQCHGLLYSHAPRRTRAPQTLPSGTSPFKSQEDPQKARKSQYHPDKFEVQAWDSTNGYLQPFMHEQIKNNYLYLWTSHQPSAFRNLEPYYKKLLAYKKDEPSALNVSSLNCLKLFQPDYKKLEDNVPNLYRLFYSPRHQHMGYPLTMAELAAIYAYTLEKGPYKDFNNALRNGDYHKWRWMDGLLHKGITKLSFLEEGYYPLYTGFKNIYPPKKRQHNQRWQDYTSSTPYPAIATTFHGSNGIKITIDPSMRKSKHVPCCDVSWISPYSYEGEVLFARGIAGHSKSSMRGEDGWEMKVTGKEHQLQQISVWHKAIFQQLANYPLPMRYQLFGHSQGFIFQPATYHQLMHRLLSGQDIHQKLGLQKDRSLLLIAAENGHTELVALLMDQDDIKINLQYKGTSPLSAAAKNGHTDIVKLLLGHENIKVNLQDDDGQLPLLISAQQGYTDIVKLLLRHPKIKVNLQNQGVSPLFMAAQNGHTDIVKLLLRHPKIKVNLQKDDGSSSLFMAAQEGHTAIVKLLLDHDDIDVNLHRDDNVSPLWVATKHNQTDVITLLLYHDNINVNLQADKGGSALFVAAAKGHTDVVKLLLGHDDINVNLQENKGASALYMAAQNGHTDIVKLLLRHPKIKVNLQINNGASPLWVAAENGHTEIVRILLQRKDIKINLQTGDGASVLCIAADNGNTEVVRLLLYDSRIKVNLKRDSGSGPHALFMAAQQGHTDIVKLLLDHDDINVNLQTNQGASSLYMAALNGHTDIVKLLLRHPKIKVNLQDEIGLSPLFMAANKSYTDIVKLLLRHPKIKVNLQMNDGASPLFMAANKSYTDIVKLLLRHPKIKVNLQYKGISPLLMATQNGHTEVVKFLLDHNDINVNLQMNDGTSPLFMAANKGHTDIVKLLLKHDNISVNLQRDTGISPLLMAAQNGHTEVVKFLLDHNDINVNLQADNGGSPLLIAAQNGHTEVVELLLAHPGIQVNLTTQDAKATALDFVYWKMQTTQDPAVWDKYHIIWWLLKTRGVRLLYYANAYPQPPQRP